MTGSKLTNVGDEGQANQDAVTISQIGNTITINADIDEGLTAYARSAGGPSAKWVGLAIDTGEEDLLEVSKDGTPFDQTAVTEATSYDLDEGNFVLWVDAGGEGVEFTLSTDGKRDTVVNIVINDTGE